MSNQTQLDFEIAINRSYGGFSIDKEMADYLIEKGWKTTTDPRNRDDKTIFQINSNDKWVALANDSVVTRSDPIFLDCVRFFQDKYKDLDWIQKDRHNSCALKIKIVNVTASVEVEQYNDGHERVIVNCYNDCN